jgi:hypothetical protein
MAIVLHSATELGSKFGIAMVTAKQIRIPAAMLLKFRSSSQFSVKLNLRYLIFPPVFATFTITIQNQFKFYLLKVYIYTQYTGIASTSNEKWDIKILEKLK